MKKGKEGLQFCLTGFLIVFFTLYVPITVWGFMGAFSKFCSMPQYLIPLIILVGVYIYTSWKMFVMIGAMFRGSSQLEKHYRTYKCNDMVVMDGDGNEEQEYIVFTEGWSYTPINHYYDGYIMVNDHGDTHYVPYYFLKLHFKVV